MYINRQLGKRRIKSSHDFSRTHAGNSRNEVEITAYDKYEFKNTIVD